MSERLEAIILDRSSNSFGDLEVKVLVNSKDGELVEKTLYYDEGDWGSLDRDLGVYIIVDTFKETE